MMKTTERPGRAASAPRSARNSKEPPETLHVSAALGLTRTRTSGKAAPTANVPADAKAA